MKLGTVACFLSALVLLSAVLVKNYRHLLYSYDGMKRDRQSNYTFAIGILSARENFKQRETLRKTWLQFLKQPLVGDRGNEFLYKFIIGSEDCEVPIEDRINKFSCEWDPYIETYMEGDIIAYAVNNSSYNRQRGSIGLDFEVIHPIVVTKLGILAVNKGELFDTSLKVTIFDTVSKKEILSTAFNEHCIESRDGFLLTNVDNILLPKEFRGTIVVDGQGQDVMVAYSNGSCWINDGGGLIKFKKVIRSSILTGFFPTDAEDSGSFCSVLAGTFAYQPYGVESRKSGDSVLRVKERLNRMHLWNQETQKRSILLEKEKNEHGDILFLDLKDVYRNVPLKLLKFYKWVDDNCQFRYVIKTDDDCYLKILEIFKVLESYTWNGREGTWHGNFRFNWPLDKFGKWAEQEYTSYVYPAFACGSGYVLSRQVVKWISRNVEYLHTYQGEDVSTGIWLAAINPRLVDDKRWSCYKICNDNMLSLPNNSPEELLSLYSNHVLCGNPCECSS